MLTHRRVGVMVIRGWIVVAKVPARSFSEKIMDIATIQRHLYMLGYVGTADGILSASYTLAVRVFQQDKSLTVDGVAGPITQRMIEDAVRVAPILIGFRGNLQWVHGQEGHDGSAYWPGGASGVTIDPGFDLGHVDPDLFERLYHPLLTPDQMAACRRIRGLKSEYARIALRESPLLRSIRISREQAHTVFPHAAKPYWQGITKRFPKLIITGCPGAVHTAMLSLAYNRGAANTDLNVLRVPIQTGDWKAVGETIGKMQQDHEQGAIRDRRRREEALVLASLA